MDVYKGSCNNCIYFMQDFSTGTSDCGQFDNMTESEIDLYYTEGAAACPYCKPYDNIIE